MEHKLDLVLDDCLARLAAGHSLEDSIAAYPEMQAELRALLTSAAGVRGLVDIKPSAAFRSKTRNKLQEVMRANPRRKSWRTGLTLKYAVTLAALLLAFVTTGTALAQSALPGDLLYSWKLNSERVWLNLQANAVDAELHIAARRVQELSAVRGVPGAETIGIQAYSWILRQLQSDLAANPSAVAGAVEAITSHQSTFGELFAGTQIELPDFQGFFDSFALPEEEAPEDDEGEGMLPEQGGSVIPATAIASNTAQSVPTLASAIPTLPLATLVSPKHEDDGSNAGADEDDRGWLEKAVEEVVDGLLGLP